MQHDDPWVFPSQAPLFTIKSKLFPKSTFVIGYDTAIRLVMGKYYGGEVPMLLEMTAMRNRGCSFLVAGRLDAQSAFKTMEDVELPEHLRDIVRPIPALCSEVHFSALPGLLCC